MEDSVKKIKTIKSVTFAKKIKTAKPVTPAKNIVSIPIESISASVSIPVKFVCDSFLVKFVESLVSAKNSFPTRRSSDLRRNRLNRNGNNVLGRSDWLDGLDLLGKSD